MLRAGGKILDFHTTQQRKFNSKWNVDLNVKSDTLKFSDENTGEFFIIQRQGSTQKKGTKKGGKIDKFNQTKILNTVPQKIP